MTDEERKAAAELVRFAASGHAAEFMQKVVYGNGMYTWQPDGTLLIFDDDQTSSIMDQLGCARSHDD